MAAAVRLAFPSAPPSGGAAEWLSLVEPEELRSALADIEAEWRRGLADDRVEVTEPYFQDSVKGLRDAREKRSLEVLKDDLGDDEKLREMGERLRSLRPKY